jgi:hypothetical protein
VNQSMCKTDIFEDTWTARPICVQIPCASIHTICVMFVTCYSEYQLSNEMAAYKKLAPSSSQPAGLSIPVPTTPVLLNRRKLLRNNVFQSHSQFLMSLSSITYMFPSLKHSARVLSKHEIASDGLHEGMVGGCLHSQRPETTSIF